ncbi:MAG: glycosyltransferase [Deltaproteobacteria bacterium]
MNHLLVSYHTCPLEEPGAGLAGGMNVFLRGLLPGLARRGVRTDVLTRGKGTSVEITAPWPGVRIVHLPCGWRTPASREGALDALPRFAAEGLRFVSSARTAWDVVSAHYWMSGIAALRLAPPRLPLVLTYHTVEALKARPARARPDRLFLARMAAEEALAREADRVVCFTRRDLAATRKALPRLAGKGAVIPPGVGDAFRRRRGRPEARRLLRIPPRAFLFLLVARPDPEKNVPGAVAAFRDLARDGFREGLLLVAGQERPPGAVPDGVVFAGPVPHDRMPSLYAAADAVLCPSLYESFGLVQLEAMAAGVPVIVPAGGFWGDTIRREGGGVVYDPRGGRGLADAMGAVARDAGLRTRLAGEAERAASAFTWERCTASWARLLSTLSRRGSRRGIPRAPAGPRRR